MQNGAEEKSKVCQGHASPSRMVKNFGAFPQTCYVAIGGFSVCLGWGGAWR